MTMQDASPPRSTVPVALQGGIRLLRRWRWFDLGTFLSILLFVVLIGGWQLSVVRGLVPAFVLPAPSDVAMRVMTDLVDKAVLYDGVYTLTEISSWVLRSRPSSASRSGPRSRSCRSSIVCCRLTSSHCRRFQK